MLDLTQLAAASAGELRDALAALAEALDVPPGVPVDDHVRNFREQIAARSGL
jgi:hypothetical protein